MKVVIFLASLLMSINALATTRVAVIDTGLNLEDARFKPYLCSSGHMDYTGTGIKDTHGHGTFIVGSIISNAGKGDYCIIILKFFDNDSIAAGDLTWKAIDRAVEYKSNIINMSFGGYNFISSEYNSIKKAKNIKIVAAIGNDNKNIDETPYYPAAYPLKNIIKIGNLQANGIKSPKSNYGYGVVWEYGTNIISTCITGDYCVMSGTSMAAGIYTGKLVRKILENN